MDTPILVSRLSNIFRDVFDDPSLELCDDMTAADVETWDSLSNIDMVVAVEKDFRIRLTTAEVRSLNNVGDLIMLISKKAA